MASNLVWYIGLAAFAGFLILWVVGVFNSGISLGRTIDQSFGNIESVLKQRYDELPKLVNACEAYMAHEKSTLEELTRLRSAYRDARSVNEKVEVENALSSQLGKLRVTVEAYPDLKASQQFLQVHERITGLETTLNDRREQFNQAVTQFNIFIEQFPARLVTPMFGFRPRELLRIPQSEQANPELFQLAAKSA
jgi:LemA protein